MLFIAIFATLMVGFCWGWYQNRHNSNRIFDEWDNPSAWDKENDKY